MKKLTSALVLSVLFIGQAAFAQSFFSYPTYSTNTTYSGSCVSLTHDLSVGSRGADVLSLQNFILTRNYPGAGSWMLTSYFGTATRAGVINFQIDSSLPQTGILDASTRAALSRATCGDGQQGSYIPSYTYPTTSWPAYYCNSTYGNSYPYNYGYNNCPSNTTLQILYISPQSGGVGSSATIFGSGFSTTGNTVHFGNGIITGLNSPDGRSVSFTVPATLSGYGYSQVVVGATYNISVTTSAGATSNSVPFTVTSLGSYGAPSITNVSGPNALPVNVSGTWTLTLNNQYNSTYTNVSVNWGDPVYGAYTSAPQQVYTNGSQTLTFSHSYAQTGTYSIIFTASNASGQSNTASATVNVSGSASSGLTISYITPTSGPVGTQIQIVGSGFTGDNTVHFGQGGQLHLTSASGNYISYTIPAYASSCDIMPGTQCFYAQPVSPGSYQMYVTNSNGTSNVLTFIVQ